MTSTTTTTATTTTTTTTTTPATPATPATTTTTTTTTAITTKPSFDEWVKVLGQVLLADAQQTIQSLADATRFVSNFQGRETMELEPVGRASVEECAMVHDGARTCAPARDRLEFG